MSLDIAVQGFILYSNKLEILEKYGVRLRDMGYEVKTEGIPMSTSPHRMVDPSLQSLPSRAVCSGEGSVERFVSSLEAEKGERHKKQDDTPFFV